MEWILSLVLGVALSATCGFRVFVPLLGLSIAGASGHLDLAPGWAWLSAPPAMVVLSVATLLEIVAYYIPWVDNALDVLGAPAAVVAGTMVAASVMGETSPLLSWSLAAVAGGGSALAVHSGMASLRALSLGSSGGLFNPVVSTLELVASVTATLLSLWLPALTLGALLLAMMLFLRWRQGRKASSN